MKFNIPKIIRPLDLGTYEEEMKDIILHVWVNPTRDMLSKSISIQTELLAIIKTVEMNATSELDEKEKQVKPEKIDEQMVEAMKHQYEWYSRILSQNSSEETRLSPEELKELDDQDMALWQFVRFAVNGMIKNHREGIKKG